MLANWRECVSSISVLGFSVPAEPFDAAIRAFTREQYDEAINSLVLAINKAVPEQDELLISVYDVLVFLAKCYRWKGDFVGVDMICSYLENTDRWDQKDPDIVFITAHKLSNNSRGFAELFPDINALECLTKKDFRAREKLLIRGIGYLRLGQFNKAVEDFEVGHLFSVLMEDYRLQAEFANCLGLYYLGIGNIRHAIEWFIKSHATGAITNAHRRLGISSLNLGICMYKAGDYCQAKEYIDSAIGYLDGCGDPINLCRSRLALVNLYRLTRSFDQAQELLIQTYATACSLKSPREECLALEFFGDLCRDRECSCKALNYYRRSKTIADVISPDGELVGGLLRREGEYWILQGSSANGLELLVKALTHARKLGDRFEEGVVLRCLAEGFLQVGDHPQALDYTGKAIAMLEEIDARHEHAIARLVAGEILLRHSSVSKNDDPRDLLDQAWDHSIIAQGIILKLDIDHWTDAVKRLQKQIMKRRQEEMAFQSGQVVLPDTTGGAPVSGNNQAPPQIIIAESRAMREVLQATEAYATYGESVLLTGETGTGKEIVAQLLHQQGKRKTKPMISVNMTALAPSMFERELFGHAKGSFSGADADGLGLAAAADGGTLFLDEIGELPLEMQVKLLRLLQNGCYLRLGDPIERRADLRIIAATNKDLKKAVANGQFREDLYHRLVCLTIHVPALRDRREDVLPLLEHYLSVSEKRKVTVDQYFCELSRRLLERYRWPGNVREVIQVARRACVAKARHGRVEMELGDGEESIILSGPGHLTAAAACGAADATALTRARLLLALEECGGSRTEAARALGVSRSAVYRRLKKFGLA